MTNANRPDKLFWNIIGSLPKESEALSRATVRSIRLRAELLTLYEAFDEIRINLNPKSKRCREFKKLFEDVSGKVLLSYQKKYLSTKDFEAIKKKLMVIDGTLAKALQKPARSIPSKVSAENPRFEGVSLKRAGIQAPLQTTDAQGNLMGSIVSLDQNQEQTADITLKAPLSLTPYHSIDLSDEFLIKLGELHALGSTMHNGTVQEKNWALNEVFRFFQAVPLDDLFKPSHFDLLTLTSSPREINPDSF